VAYETNYSNNVSAPIGVVVEPLLTNAIRFVGWQRLTNGAFGLNIQATPSGTFTLQTSTNLTNWSRVMDFFCTNVTTLVIDSNTSIQQVRFYRVTPLSGVSP